MTKRCWGLALSLSAALIAATGAARADSLDDWRKRADKVIAIYEQSSGLKEYDAVTPDFDCQGLSLGSKQWPFRNGSIRKIFRRLGADVMARTINASMPKHGDTFLRAANASLKGRHATARRITLELQSTKSGGCKGRKGTGLVHSAKNEIQRWLRTPEVLAAQKAEEQVISRRAIRVAACWAKRIRKADAPRYAEYLFFYDYLVQNGGGWVEDGILIDAFSLMNYGQYGKSDKQLVKEKLDQVIQFYETDWRVAAAKGYLRDGKRNAEILREAQAAGEIGKGEVGLLMLKTFRGMLGNTPYGLISMNRGVVSLLGRGYYGGKRYDIRSSMRRAGALSPGQIPAKLRCRR